jgi:hypothetical protein
VGGRPWPGAKKDGISKKGEGIPVQEGEVDDQMLQVGDEYQREVHPRGQVETNRLQLHHVLILGVGERCSASAPLKCSRRERL